ncbi:MAG: hypothetical protein ACR2PO_08260 [Methyloligellaceae bacterium]
MPLPPWPELALFMALVLVIFVFIVAVSGHFPLEYRADAFKGALGAAVLWGSIAVAAISALLALVFVYQLVPWYAAVIGGGLMILAAPYVLQPLPDRIVNGRGALLMLAAIAAGLDVVAWRLLG